VWLAGRYNKYESKCICGKRAVGSERAVSAFDRQVYMKRERESSV
jgi:hypothetical protein